MRLFILDDDGHRHDVISTWFKEADKAHAYTYHEAIEVVEKQPRFDLWHLDHDLDMRKSQISDGFGVRDATGLDFCDWVFHFLPRDKFPERVVVHSWNPEGARKMGRRLYDLGMRVLVKQFKVSNNPGTW